MDKKILYLIPDTNLFIQCHPLHVIDWAAYSDFAEFQEIQLLVCNPVHREIDKMKVSGSDRIRQQARNASSDFRKIVISGEDYKVINGQEPVVKLLIGQASRPSGDLAEELDYNKADDEIVGCLYEVAQARPEEDVRLLTHDGNMMVTAKNLNLPFVPIPDEWVRPPEKSGLEKELEKLKRENIRLRRAEPEFCAKMVDSKGREIDPLDVTWQSYEPLSEESIGEFIDELSGRFPMVTSFDSNVNSLAIMSGLMQTPREEEIRRYYDEYSNWTGMWRYIFANMHNILPMMSAPSFRIEATNSGVRPGKDILVEIISRGPFKIRPHLLQTEQEAFREQVFPLPPAAPQTKSITDAMMNVQPNYPYLHSQLALNDDPNEFYFKSDRPQAPVDSFSLQCEQWRHGPHQEVFDGQIFLNSPFKKLEGAIECVIQAENLSEPAIRTLPVRFTIEERDTLEPTQSLIIELSDREGTKV